MSFLNAEEPSACDLVTDFGIHILWHPSLGVELGDNLQKLLRDCVSGAVPLDIFVFEGTVVTAPNGTGQWNRFAGRAMQEWVSDLSKAATFVVAIGDCATWGGIPATAPNPSNSRGLQFLKRAKGGYLGDGFVSKSGLPVINVPGCPAHPDWITQIVVAVATGRAADIGLDEFQRPKALEIIDVEGRGLCSGCGAEPVMTMPLGRCPVCHEPSLRIVAGTELKIKEMEVESCV